MDDQSQFRLLSQRRFLPFFLTQFSGAFNDNLFKNVLLLLLTYTAGGLAGLPIDVVVNMAAFLFILPFFLFSSIAGQVADKYEKAGFMRWVKAAEILIMSIAAFGLWYEWYELLLALLFLMGIQSTFFSPVKYAILPQVLENHELVGGNALVGMGTFVAILLGTIAAGLMMGFEQPHKLAAIGALGIAIAGYLVARKIPKTGATRSDVVIGLNPFRETWRLMRLAAENRAVLMCIMAISWFWFMGAAYLTQFPNFAQTDLMGNETVVTLLLAIFTIGIALGSMTCEHLSGKRIELGIVPIGSLGLTLFGVDLYLSMPADPSPTTWWTMVTDPEYRRIVFDLLGIGFFGGLFIVPLYAFVQRETPEDRRAKVIAGLNVFNSLFMVVSALMAMIMLGVIGISIPEFFLVLSIMNLIVAGFVYQQLPEFVLRFIVWVLSHTFYRVKHQGLQNIPDQGPALLVCNHISYVDALVIAGAVQRPVRFVMDHHIFRAPLLGGIFRMAQAIPIGSKSSAPEVYSAAFDRIDEELKAGHVVCIFPEGRLTTDGEIASFRSGVDMILERRPVPVVPMALRGLWGSFFSHCGGPAMRHFPRRFWSRIELLASPPIPPEDANARMLEVQVKDLRGKAR